MQLRLIAVDKLRTSSIAEVCADFRKRLAPYTSFEEIEVKPSHGGDPIAAMRDEGERILKYVRPGEPLWLLERTGMQLTSEALARKLDAIAHEGTSRLTFVVAGTFGVGEALMQRADFLWSLSDLTFLHEWARMIVLEQLYRAAKISRNEPYHH